VCAAVGAAIASSTLPIATAAVATPADSASSIFAATPTATFSASAIVAPGGATTAIATSTEPITAAAAPIAAAAACSPVLSRVHVPTVGSTCSS